MKKLVFSLVFVAFCVSLFVGGAVLNLRAAVTGQIETTEGVKYNYLNISDRSLIAADADNIFVTDEQNYILKVNRTSGQTVLKSTSQLMSTPRCIRVVGGTLFVFFDTSFQTWLTSNLTLSGTGYSLSLSSSFYVKANGSAYHVYAAYKETVLFYNFIPQTNTCSLDPSKTKTLTGQQITGIATEGETVYVLATVPQSGSLYGIYNAETKVRYDNAAAAQIDTSNLINISSGKFALITENDRKRVTYFNGSDYTPLSDPEETTTRELKSSYRPICIATLSPSEIFVLDGVKKSIDQYKINEEGLLEFDTTIAAHFGDDNGFYYDPTAICTTEGGRYVVADRAGLKLIDMSKPAENQTTLILEKPSSRIMLVAYDYYKHIYTYDENNQIKKYELVFTYNKDNLITAVSFNQNPVQTIPVTGKILQLVASPDQNVYALNQNGKIEKISGTTLTPLVITPSVTVTASTRAAVYETETGFMMYLINPNTEINLTNLTSASKTYTAGGTVLLDIATDALREPVVLSKDTANTYYLNNEEIEGKAYQPATVAGIPSLCTDRLNAKAFWLGENHSIQSAELDLWSPEGASTYQWNKKDPVERLTTAEAQTLFIKTRPDTAAVLYTYPNAMEPIAQISAAELGVTLKVLKYETVIDGHTLPYAYAMYETQGSESMPGKHYVGYIAYALTEEVVASDYSTTDLKFRPQNQPLAGAGSGRIILNGVLIFKYPTSVDFELVAGSAPKNFNLPDGDGLIINREITVADLRGWVFYEVGLDANGSPDPFGPYVGYIAKGHVIDSTEPPSNVQFSSNARIVALASEKVQVYGDASNQFPYENEYLVNKQEIRISMPFDKSQPYTRVTFVDKAIGLEYTGYVETRYIKPDGISALQVIGVILVAGALIAVAVLLVRSFRTKKKHH